MVWLQLFDPCRHGTDAYKARLVFSPLRNKDNIPPVLDDLKQYLLGVVYKTGQVCRQDLRITLEMPIF